MYIEFIYCHLRLVQQGWCLSGNLALSLRYRGSALVRQQMQNGEGRHKREREREQLKTERDTKQQKHRHNKEERGYRQADEEVLEIRNR